MRNSYQNLSTRQHSNILKIVAVCCVISGALLLSLFILPVSQAAPDTLPPLAPSPRPPLSDGNNGDTGGDSGGPSSAIYGTVTDLSRQQPGSAIEVLVNGAVVRTDSDGSYSITGLNAGDYTISLELDGQGQPAQGIVHVALDGSRNAIVNLEYYSQPSPTDTPQPTATRIPAISTATPPAGLPDSGAPINRRPPALILLGLALLVTGIVLFNKSRVNPNHKKSTSANQ